MLQKFIVALGIFISLGLVWAALSVNPEQEGSLQGNSNVVREENGTQYIRITARGGYSPDQITAKANMPTVLEIETKGTYDCSSSLNIPKLNYREFLPATGITKIDVPQNLTTAPLDILCGMGMYTSTINFGA